MAPEYNSDTGRVPRKKGRPSRFPAQHSSQQHTVPNLFNASKHKQSSNRVNGEPFSHGTKRRKLETTQPADSTVDTMYSFENGVVDLTKVSPQTSKHRRLSQGMRVESPQKPTAKKMIVTNLRPATSNSAKYFATAMTQLRGATDSIFANCQPIFSNEELYRASENVCRLGKAPELMNMLFERCWKQVMQGIVPNMQGGDGLLEEIVQSWSEWKRQLEAIRGIFFFLERSYCLPERKTSIKEHGYGLYRRGVFEDPAIKAKAIDGTCQLLMADRAQQNSSTVLFSGVIKTLNEVAVYTTMFEPRLLASSQEFLTSWSDKECAEKELPQYVAVALALINSEMQRCEDYGIELSTKRELINLLDNHLVERREGDLTDNDSVADLLDQDGPRAMKNLQDLYAFLQRKGLGKKLVPAFKHWIDFTGTSIVYDDKAQDQMVIKLLRLKRKLDNIWRHAFEKDRDLENALRETFQSFMNKTKKTSLTWNTDNTKAGEMIAKYVDMLLRAGAKGIPGSLASSHSKPISNIKTAGEGDDDDSVDEDAEVNDQLDQVLDLFRFVEGKAVFEAFYKKDLARRLLMGRSASADAEKNMLARLETECGDGFTANLQTMFRDIELAREEMSTYKTRMEEIGSNDDIDLSVNILSSAAWPSYPDISVAVPREIEHTINSFQNYYQLKHSGRKLTWKHALAHCQMKADFPRGGKELIVSSFQAIVLLLFNGIEADQRLTYEHIKAASGLPDAEAKRTMQSLACAKLRPLTKHPLGKEINDSDTFSVNTKFHHDKYRVKINSIQLKETKEENQETHVRVAADRQFETQAAIVRIMKSKKSIAHAVLVSEVIQATRTRGTLNVADIKKNIDKLIDKEYMERAENNSYNYLA